MAGRRRFQALTELGWKKIPVRTIKSEGELFDFRVALIENIARKNLSDPEESAAIAEYDELKRKVEGKKPRGRRWDNSPQHSELETGWTQDKTAADLGISRQAVTKAIQIAEAVEEKPDRIKLKTGTAILRDVKKENAVKNLENISVKEAKKVEGVYDVIVCDPPWPMEKIERDCRPNQVAMDYPTLSEDQIIALKPPCAEDAHVFLWTTVKFLPMAFRILDAWDLRYVFCMTWCKAGGFQPVGLAQFNSEFCLYARKGKPSFVDTKDFKICFHGKRREHSRKPDEFFETVTRVTAGRRLEMFAREDRRGWDSWGNEV